MVPKKKTDFTEDKKQMAKKHSRSTHECMVRLWGRLIIWGTATLDDVPENLRDEVEKWAEENSGL